MNMHCFNFIKLDFKQVQVSSNQFYFGNQFILQIRLILQNYIDHLIVFVIKPLNDKTGVLNILM